MVDRNFQFGPSQLLLQFLDLTVLVDSIGMQVLQFLPQLHQLACIIQIFGVLTEPVHSIFLLGALIAATMSGMPKLLQLFLSL